MDYASPDVFTAAALSWALPDTLRHLAMTGDRSLVAEVIADFQSDTTRRLRLMNEAIGKQDFAALRAEAHAIRGAASEVGAERLAAVCKRIELSAAATDAGEIANSQCEAHLIFAAVCRVMRERGWNSE